MKIQIDSSLIAVFTGEDKEMVVKEVLNKTRPLFKSVSAVQEYILEESEKRQIGGRVFAIGFTATLTPMKANEDDYV